MTKHAMHYVQLGNNVLKELDQGETGRAAILYAQRALIEAEQSVVRAYGLWRDAMKLVAEGGSELATRYVEESTWDLT